MNDFDINFVSCALDDSELALAFTEDDLWTLDYPTEPSVTHHDPERIMWMERNGTKYFNDKKFFPVSVDGFFRNPAKVCQYSATLEKFPHPNGDWPGKRSKNLQEIAPDLSAAILEKILSCYGDGIRCKQATLHFQEIHCNCPNDKDDVRNKGWIHADFNPAPDGQAELAGLIYLSQGIDPDSGTSLFNRIPITEEIEEDYYKIREDAITQKRSSEMTWPTYKEVYERHENCFIEKVRFQNIYNRMIAYDTNEFHRANSYYGGISSSRLTLVFFIGEIDMGHGQKYPLEKVKNVKNENIIKREIK